jgi:hypothetical protein
MVAPLVVACVPPTFPLDVAPAPRPASKTFDADKETVYKTAAVALVGQGSIEYVQDLGIIKGHGPTTKESFDKWTVPPMEDRFIYARHAFFNVVVIANSL